MYTKVFICYSADEFMAAVQRCILGDQADELRRLQQKSDGADMIWKSWTMTNGGSVLTGGGGQGQMEVPPEKLVELPKLMKQYSDAIAAPVAMGVGAKLSEAQIALDVSKVRGGDQIVLYAPGIEEEIEAKESKPDPIKDILDEKYHNESAVQKSLRKGLKEDIDADEAAEKDRKSKQPNSRVTIMEHPPGGLIDGKPDVPRPGLLIGVRQEGKHTFAEVQDEVTGDVRRFHQLVHRSMGPNPVETPTNTWQEIQMPCARIGEMRRDLTRECRGQNCPRCKGTGWAWYAGGSQLKFEPYQAKDTDVKKALAQNQGPGAGFGGFARGGGAAPPAPPMQEQSEHSDAQAVQQQINDPELPKPPEMTHAAQDLETQFHNLASQQEVKDAQSAQEQQTDLTAIKGAVVSVLQQVRAQSAQLGALKQEAPDAYTAVMALVQSVIAMAHSLGAATAQPMAKAEEDDPYAPNMGAWNGDPADMRIGDKVTIMGDEYDPRRPFRPNSVATIARIHVHPRTGMVYAVDAMREDTGTTHTFMRGGRRAATGPEQKGGSQLPAWVEIEHPKLWGSKVELGADRSIPLQEPARDLSVSQTRGPFPPGQTVHERMQNHVEKFDKPGEQSTPRVNANNLPDHMKMPEGQASVFDSGLDEGFMRLEYRKPMHQDDTTLVKSIEDDEAMPQRGNQVTVHTAVPAPAGHEFQRGETVFIPSAGVNQYGVAGQPIPSLGRIGTVHQIHHRNRIAVILHGEEQPRGFARNSIHIYEKAPGEIIRTHDNGTLSVMHQGTGVINRFQRAPSGHWMRMGSQDAEQPVQPQGRFMDAAEVKKLPVAAFDEVYDYSHLLPPDLQAQGHKLVVGRRGGDGFTQAVHLDAQGVSQGSDWMYPYTSNDKFKNLEAAGQKLTPEQMALKAHLPFAIYDRGQAAFDESRYALDPRVLVEHRQYTPQDDEIGDADETRKSESEDVPLPKDHEPAIKVPKGGSSCASCKYFNKDGGGEHGTCEAEGFHKFYGKKEIPVPADEFCSDWYEPKKSLPIVDDKMEKAGIRLPMPKVPQRKDLELPVGSVREAGPTGSSAEEVGKIKVQHGDGSTSWVEARAGQVTAVADRHAPPNVGQASHPISSRNPTGH